jgi:hypothetical protein
MRITRPRRGAPIATALMLAGFGLACMASAKDGPAPQDSPAVPKVGARKLSHDESLKWVEEHKAWKLAKKTRPIWARPVEPDEDGKEFHTADHVKQVARKDSWLCVGSAGEPWFQALDKIEGKYEPSGEEVKSFRFDTGARTYKLFKPKGDVKNWVAQVKGPGIEGFFIKPGYDPERPLYSPAGGYVVKDHVADPYQDNPKDVWLVQQPLFESTYSLVPEGDEKPQ